MGESIEDQIIGSTVSRWALFKRNGVVWASARSWRASTKAADLAELKRQKFLPLPPFVPRAARECAELARHLLGGSVAGSVTSVPCGHSRRADCAGQQLAQATSIELGIEYRARFADRFVSGSSHPKEFKVLEPAYIVDNTPSPLVLVVDDVATSGWHLEDALGALREAGFCSLGIVWISGESAASELVEVDQDLSDFISLDL